MIIEINGKEVEYQSDYPEGWKFSAGDPFKFPVLIGNQACFVKRFEQKNPKNISGWELLLKLRGEKERYLSNIYDIKRVEENGKDIYYIFYEYLEGNTLDKHVRTGEINLSVLCSSLFSAIRSLQKYDFWFADFCEKNIFCRKDGTFVLVDVDSTQRLIDMPDNEMYGSKDYWILVFKFYKEILNKNNIRLSDINGISFNFLQIVFLILRLKLFYQGKRKDYNSTELYNQLPARLNDIVPQIREIFLKVFEKGTQPISESDVNHLENLVNEKIINVEKFTETPVHVLNLPVIKEFASNAAEVERGGEFTLSWQVENANKLELYKNGAMFRSLDLAQSELKLVGFADGTRQQLSFQLLAYKDLSVAKSEIILISLKDSPVAKENRPQKKSKKWIIVAALLVIAFILFLIFNSDRKPGDPYLKDEYVRRYVDSTITIYGSKFPSREQIRVLLNDTLANIISASADSLQVLLPKNKITTASSDMVYVFMQLNNHTKNIGRFVILPPLNIKQREVFEDSTVTIYGKKLDTDAIKVFLGDMELEITRKTEDSITAKVQQFNDTVKGRFANLSVRENNKVIFSKNWVITYEIVDLYKLAPQAKWIGGILLNDGHSTGSAVNLPFPGDLSSVHGYAVNMNRAMEDNITYPVLWTHPNWASRGTIKGFYPWKNLKGRKVFRSKVGFINNGRSSDGVTFQVWVHYIVNNAESWEQIVKLEKKYTGTLADISVDLPKRIPNDFYIELRVDAGNESGTDWAAWVRPAVISRKLRTITIKDKLQLHHPLDAIKWKDFENPD